MKGKLYQKGAGNSPQPKEQCKAPKPQETILRGQDSIKFSKVIQAEHSGILSSI